MEHLLLHKEKNLYSSIALSKMPRKILQSHNSDLLIECILYELSLRTCLDINMIAYFAYNPHFHICHGISGINRNTLSQWETKDIWENIEDFGSEALQSSFSQQIKETKIQLGSNKPLLELSEDLIGLMQDYTKEKSLTASTIQLKNENIGIFVHSQNDEHNTIEYEDGFSLIGLCPLQAN